jgi:hypothetical protein
MMSSKDYPTAPESDLDPDNEPRNVKEDTNDGPAHSTDEDEGWTSEGGATPFGPVTDVGPDA